MKIVHLTPYFAPHIGGVETHVAEVCRLLQKAGHQVTILTLQSDPDSPLQEIIDGLKIIRCPVGPPMAKSWRYKLAVWQWFWQQRSVWWSCDRIQVHDVFWWVVPFLPLIEDKVFITFHGWETTFPISPKAKFQRWLWNRVSAGSVHVGAWIKEYYWDRPSVVTYGGVRESILALPHSPPRQLQKMIFLGRLSVDNDVEKYRDLFLLLKARHPKLTITWIGDGPLREVCQKVGRVTGFIAQPEKEVRTADLVGASSYLAMWSAMAQGKVVAAFYSQALKRRYLATFPGAATILIDKDPVSMEKKVTTLYASSKKVAAFSALAAQIAGQHSWQKVTDMYLELWQKNKGIR